jgi:hypothetical protein
MESGVPVVTPVPLNDGERRFLDDLKKYWDAKGATHTGVQMYVMRNLTRGRGVGFFEAGNFYPDFIVWLVAADRQDIIFVDPKGLFHVPANDPKVQFHETIKELQSRLTQPAGETIALHSFILSRTKADTLQEIWGLTHAEIEARNVFFIDDSQYIEKILTSVMAAQLA